MLDFPITEDQIRVLDDDKLRNVLELCQLEHARRQKQYYNKLVDDTRSFSDQNIPQE